MLIEQIADKILPRILGRFDLISLYFAIIFGSYGAAQMASVGGWAAIPMLCIAVFIFLLPCALASFELGTLFPREGGIYIWAHKTCGALHGFLSGWLSWVPILLLLPLGANAITAHIQLALNAEWSPIVNCIVQVGFVWGLVFICFQPLNWAQKFIRIGFFISLSTAVIVFIVGWIQSSHPNPSMNELTNVNIFSHGALFSACVLWLLGVEMPFTMGDEYTDHRKTSKTMLIYGTLALVGGYLMGVTGILWSIPQADINPTTGVAQAVMVHFPSLGIVVAGTICLAVLSQGISYTQTYSRLLFVFAIEKHLPMFLGTVNKSKSPSKAILIQGIGASLIIIIFSMHQSLVVAFNIYLASLTVIWCLSIYYIYVAVIIARKKYISLYVAQNAWKIPGRSVGKWIVVIWGFIANTIAIYYVFALPWVSEGISKEDWCLWIGSITTAIIFIGSIIYLYGLQKERPIAI